MMEMQKLMFSYTIYHLTMENLYANLLNRLIGVNSLVFMGIGEEKLRDDGLGPYIISELLEYSNEKVLFINAGTDPMSRVDDVVNFKDYTALTIRWLDAQQWPAP